MITGRSIAAAAVLFAATAICRAAPTVVWVSVDGARADYLQRAETPFLDRLIADGALSRELVPVFPSLTFPSHASLATGVHPGEHGVTGNSFIDSDDGRAYRYPSDSRLLETEPIWTTATRQGVRVAVHDWVLSHAQRGENQAAYFGQRYDAALSDEERLAAVLRSWEIDVERGTAPPLRLLMGYVQGPDPAGHAYGPDAVEPVAAMEEADRTLEAFAARAKSLWERTREPGDELYFVITSDHGMLAVHTLVSLKRMIPADARDDVESIVGGPVGHIFLSADDEAPSRIASRIARFLDRQDFASAFVRDELPEVWQYDHAARTGDVVVVLDPGYVFHAGSDRLTTSAEDAGSPRGGHGYDPAVQPGMNGLMIVWRHPEPLGGAELGRIHSLQLHSTVAELLDIEPGEHALAAPLSFDR